MNFIPEKGPRLGLNIFNFTIFVSTTKALYNSIRGVNSHRFNESLRIVLMVQNWGNHNYYHKKLIKV